MKLFNLGINHLGSSKLEFSWLEAASSFVCKVKGIPILRFKVSVFFAGGTCNFCGGQHVGSRLPNTGLQAGLIILHWVTSTESYLVIEYPRGQSCSTWIYTNTTMRLLSVMMLVLNHLSLLIRNFNLCSVNGEFVLCCLYYLPDGVSEVILRNKPTKFSQNFRNLSMDISV